MNDDWNGRRHGDKVPGTGQGSSSPRLFRSRGPLVLGAVLAIIAAIIIVVTAAQNDASDDPTAAPPADPGVSVCLALALHYLYDTDDGTPENARARLVDKGCTTPDSSMQLATALRATQLQQQRSPRTVYMSASPTPEPTSTYSTPANDQVTSSSDDDNDFLARLRARDIVTPGVSLELSGAHHLCQEMEDGASIHEQANELLSAPYYYSPALAGYFAGEAVKVYCPQYSDQLSPN